MEQSGSSSLHVTTGGQSDLGGVITMVEALLTKPQEVRAPQCFHCHLERKFEDKIPLFYHFGSLTTRILRIII